jgi:hypothetical protein
MTPSTPTPPEENEPVVAHYFIDEAGDPVLFGKRKVIVGTQSSRYFLLGKLEVGDPVALAQGLDDLRKQLLADPYFNSAPSMKPEEGKTAVAFHAKDDLAEVRDRVFHLLTRQIISSWSLRVAVRRTARRRCEPRCKRRSRSTNRILASSRATR